MAAKRIFIAIDINDEARRRVTGYIEELRKQAGNVRVGWERPEKLHITLKFLGRMPEERLTAVNLAVAKVVSNYRAYSAEVADTGVFPSLRRPSILWLGLKDDGSTVKFAAEIETECRKLGFFQDDRPFKGHLTIARLREPINARSLALYHTAARFLPAQLEIAWVTIYESTLRLSGSIYNVLSRYELG